MLGAGKFDGKRGDHPVWLRLLRGVPWLLWEGLGCCLGYLCVGHKCAATSGYTSTIITEILCINSGAMHSGHAGSTHLSSLWEDLPQRPGPPLKGHAVIYVLELGGQSCHLCRVLEQVQELLRALASLSLSVGRTKCGILLLLVVFIASGMQVPRSVQTVGPACAASQGNSGCVSWLVRRGSRAC